ncbi:MAG: hypothetical protein AAGJ11_13375 [Bacteroidota bacterium]
MTRPPLVAEPPRRYRGYRVSSARLPDVDYGHGVFFVTIVTAGRVPWFGRLGDGRVAHTEAGRIVADEWRRTADVRPNVSVDAFVVMPDHMHGVVWIRGANDDATASMPDHGIAPTMDGGIAAVSGDGTTMAIDDGVAVASGDGVETPRRGVSTGHNVDIGGDAIAGLPAPGHGRPMKPWRPGVLGAVVSRFKASCTRRIRTVHPAFAWQARFYDVIIRDARHLEAVRRYIAENPARHTASGR